MAETESKTEKEAKTICLFDVDGTLTKPRQKADPSIHEILKLLRAKVPIAVVGGSDLVKIVEQLGDNEEQGWKKYFCFFAFKNFFLQF